MVHVRSIQRFVQRAWSADTYEWVDWIGEELTSLAKQIERQEKSVNNQLQTIHAWESDLNAL